MYTLQTFYRSKEWERLRQTLRLARVNKDGEVICAHCGKPITAAYDCIAHHKTELTEENVNDVNISLNPDNIELIHFKCHNLIHERFAGFSQQVFLVYGAPCAGKTTWVKANAGAGDLIVDVDKLWEAVSINDRLHKNNRIKSNVFGLRDCLIEQIKTRTGNWHNAFVIGGYPLRTDRDRMCDLLRAKAIYIDTPQSDCLKRAPNEAWIGFITDWFADYTP